MTALVVRIVALADTGRCPCEDDGPDICSCLCTSLDCYCPSDDGCLHID